MAENDAVVAQGEQTEPVETEVHPIVETDKVDEKVAPQEGEQEQAKRKGGWQRKIEKLERENAYWRDKVLSKPDTQPAKEEIKPPEAKPKPKPEDYRIEGTDTYDQSAFLEALADHKVNERLVEAEKKREESQKVEQRKSAEQKSLEAWHSKQGAEARKKYDDFDDAIGSATVEASPLMHEAIMESEVGGEIAYYFATHEDEALKIARMSPYRAAIAIEKIEAQFAPQEPATEKEEKEEPPPPPLTKAPKPSSPTNKPSPAADRNDPEKMSFPEFVKWREGQQKRK